MHIEQKQIRPPVGARLGATRSSNSQQRGNLILNSNSRTSIFFYFTITVCSKLNDFGNYFSARMKFRFRGGIATF